MKNCTRHHPEAIITEKSMQALQTKSTPSRLLRMQIKSKSQKAVEELFGVKVAKVNTER